MSPRPFESPREWVGVTAALIVLSVGAYAFGAEGPALARYEFSHASMGTEFRIVLSAPSRATARRAADAAFARVDELDRRLSDYRSDSELSRLSATAGTGRAIPVSDDLWSVLEAAQSIATLTDGAFDVTVGPLTRLWRWASRRGRLAPSDRLGEARSAVGYRWLRLDADRRTATLERRGMRLDLGGIGKGYAADAALATLGRHGIDRALVDAGGDVVAGAPPPGEAGWRIELAGDTAARSSTEWITLARGAVATSGDAYRFVEVEGARYSHILDPRTGLPLENRRLAIVLAPSATQADALASALSVLGAEAGLAALAGLPGVAARIREARGDRWREIDSDAWPNPSQEATWTADDS